MAKIAIVLIDLGMTTETGIVQSHFFIHRILMTFMARNRFVLALQLEFGRVMIKIPYLPVTCVMACFARRPQFAFVGILFFVTGPAIRFCVFERRRGMAFFALSLNMLSSQREMGLAVIKFGLIP